MTKKAKNKNLTKAKVAKNDEFYISLSSNMFNILTNDKNEYRVEVLY